jgi:hypothetical protein
VRRDPGGCGDGDGQGEVDEDGIHGGHQ